MRESAPLTATLAYSDYPSALAAALNLVNDLDLALHDPDGAAYFPNGLAEPDRLNNVEGIDLDAPVTGRWTLVVSAHNVPEGPQPYAIYMRGAIDLPAAIEHAPLDIGKPMWNIQSGITSPSHWTRHRAAPLEHHGQHRRFQRGQADARRQSDVQRGHSHQPSDTWVYYYLSAGRLISDHHPPEGGGLHQFAVTQPLTLTITGARQIFAVNWL